MTGFYLRSVTMIFDNFEVSQLQKSGQKWGPDPDPEYMRNPYDWGSKTPKNGVQKVVKKGSKNVL